MLHFLLHILTRHRIRRQHIGKDMLINRNIAADRPQKWISLAAAQGVQQQQMHEFMQQCPYCLLVV
ncbi:hypothetical protein D3C83_215640 [compost metagenome]